MFSGIPIAPAALTVHIVTLKHNNYFHEISIQRHTETSMGNEVLFFIPHEAAARVCEDVQWLPW